MGMIINNFLSAASTRYLLVSLAALAIASLLTWIARKVIRYAIGKRWEDGEEDVTRLKFLRNSVSAIFFALAIAYIFTEIPSLQNLGTALFAGAGVLAAVIGFASQKAFSNIISGIFILLFRPFKVGDSVNVSGRTGVVEDITLRHTVIRDYENRRVVMPNSVISDETIVNSNLSDLRIRQMVFFGISYDSDLDKAIAIIEEEAMNHPLSYDGRSTVEINEDEPVVVVRVTSWDDSAVMLRAQVWTAGMDQGFVLKCDLLRSVKLRFDKEGIEIPFPHRTLVFKNKLETHSIAQELK
jgi:small conductance mechanosensitive channel